MADEVMDHLIDNPEGIFVDGTCGTGGHTFLIAEKLSENGKIIACDLDQRMLEIAQERNREVHSQIRYVNCGYHQIADLLNPEEQGLSGFLLDLGICSLQIDRPLGFAFKEDNPLDMRFNTENNLTAADIVNGYPRGELKKIFREFGELKQAASIADRIVKLRADRAFKTTGQLSEAVADLFAADRLHKGLARLGQALRIAVNNELENLKKGLQDLTRLLVKGGRLVIISYHSLEDHIVKNFIRSYSRESGYPPELEEVLDRREFKLEVLTPQGVTPRTQETDRNPRARSARLRAAVKV